MSEWIEQEAEELLSEMVKVRRDFHRYAECGWMEMRTASRIAGKLKAIGLEPVVGRDVLKDEARMGVPGTEALEGHFEWAKAHGGDPEFLPFTRGGFTGVVVEIHGTHANEQLRPEGASREAEAGQNGGYEIEREAEAGRRSEPKVLALRFDIDALGVAECREMDHRPTAEGFASLTDGVMHACGHDGHAAIGLAAAEMLMRHRTDFDGTVRLIFQPAEEGVRGAKSVAAAGWLDDVSWLLGCHIVPSGPSGAKVAMIANGGPIGLATTKYDFEFSGKAAHAGTAPETGRNALLAAAAAVLQMHAIPRCGSAMTQVNVGKLTAGTGRNVVCDHALIEMEVRGEATEACEYMADYAVRIAEHEAAMHRVDVKCTEMGSAPVLRNSAELQKRVKKVCQRKGFSIVEAAKSEGSSEDFAYLADAVLAHGGQSFYMGFPCRTAAVNHDVRFDFDESVMTTALKVIMSTVMDVLSPRYGES